MTGTETGNLSDLSAIANILTGVTAVAALTLAWWQTAQFRRHQLEAVARDHYQTYLTLCIEHPQFASPSKDRLDVTRLTFDGSTESFNKYEWFFTAGSNALEAIFETCGSNSIWRETILNVLNDHEPYIRSARYKVTTLPTVEPRFQEFIETRFH